MGVGGSSGIVIADADITIRDGQDGLVFSDRQLLKQDRVTVFLQSATERLRYRKLRNPCSGIRPSSHTVKFLSEDL